MAALISNSVLLYVISSLFTLAAVILGWCYLRRRRHAEPSIATSSRVEPDGLDSTKDETKSTASELANIAENDDLNNSWPIDPAVSDMLIPSSAISPLSSEHKEGPDPVEYCGHIQREIKRTKQRVALNQIESSMTKEQLAAERDIQRKQMEEIFRLLEAEKDKYGIQSVNDIEQQIKLYVQ